MASLAGFVLKTTKLKETDAILEIFTQTQGKISCYAKGIYSSMSKRRSSLEAMNLIEFNLADGPKNRLLPLLQEVKLISNFSLIKISESYYAECFLLSEVLTKLLVNHQVQPKIYSLLAIAAQLDHPSLGREFAAYLLVKILADLGYLADLKICRRTGEKLNLDQGILALNEEPGFVQLTGSDPIPQMNQILKVLSFWQTSDTLTDFTKIKLEPSLLQEIFNLLLDWLESILGNALKSRQLLTNL